MLAVKAVLTLYGSHMVHKSESTGRFDQGLCDRMIGDRGILVGRVFSGRALRTHSTCCDDQIAAEDKARYESYQKKHGSDKSETSYDIDRWEEFAMNYDPNYRGVKPE